MNGHEAAAEFVTIHTRHHYVHSLITDLGGCSRLNMFRPLSGITFALFNIDWWKEDKLI
jgi:hypothetical protein